MLTITVDKKAEKPLYIQIRDQFEHAIKTGVLQPGDKLPPVTIMAKNIGVTQATIRRALEDLSKAGHAKCHVGRGTFIEDAVSLKESQGVEDPVITKQPDRTGYFIRPELKSAARRLRSGIKKSLKDLLSLSGQSGHIQFANGIPDHRLGYGSFFQEIVEETIKDNPVKFLEHGDCQGSYELRKEIADRYVRQGLHATPEQILITNGAQQAASIAAQDSLEQRLQVLCETPCFQGIPETFQAHGNWVDSVQRDPSGPLPDHLEQLSQNGPCLLYICPEMHNPTGMDITSERMDSIVAWAKRTKSIVLADEIYRDLRFDGPAPKGILNELGKKQGVVISSISKTFLSGLRVGWMVTSSSRVQEYVNFKRLMDQACPPLMQGIVLNMFRSGKYDTHVENMRRMYLTRRNIMLDCLDQMMPSEVEWTTPRGGFAVWLTLPAGYSSVALLLSAMDRGINFLPGPIFDIDQRFVNTLRLSYAWTDQDQIAEGIEILADAVKEQLRKPPGDSGLSGLGNFQ